jgi:uncharacterized protein (TIGR01777 family)
MRIVIAGGTGFLGTALTASLRAARHDVAVLSRHPRRTGDVTWNPDRQEGWPRVVADAHAVINLAGESIAGGRWTPERKAGIRTSRVKATRALATAILRAHRKPAVFLSGSAVGFYGPRGDEPVTEATPPGSDFLATVCREWETEALAAKSVTRLALLRSGMVLAREGGALPRMALPFQFFAGGPVGSGRQGISWIHLADWIGMVTWALTEDVSGPLNVTSPEPVSNREFAHALGGALRRPAFLTAPEFAVRLALGEMADVVLTGQRVLPAKAEGLRFRFRYPDVREALAAIYG